MWHSMCREAFEPRTDKEQRDLGERYRKLTTNHARTQFVKEHATRFTQLSRLPYFDLVRQVVIDPMHNMYLGTYLFRIISICLTFDSISTPYRSCQEPFLRDMGAKQDFATQARAQSAA